MIDGHLSKHTKSAQTRARGTCARPSGRQLPPSIVPGTSQTESGPTKISGTRSTLINPRTEPPFHLRSTTVVPTHVRCVTTLSLSLFSVKPCNSCFVQSRPDFTSPRCVCVCNLSNRLPAARIISFSTRVSQQCKCPYYPVQCIWYYCPECSLQK